MADTLEKLCPCGKEPLRPNQRNGYECHRLANQVYRLRVKHSAEKLQKLLFAAFVKRTALADLPEV